MGQNGNWKLEGYSFKITEEGGFFKVLAFTKDQELAAQGVFRIASQLIGWTEEIPDPDHLSVTSIDVKPDHQRKGLASEMYQLIEEHTNRSILKGEILQTSDAKEFWKNRNS